MSKAGRVALREVKETAALLPPGDLTCFAAGTLHSPLASEGHKVAHLSVFVQFNIDHAARFGAR